MNHSLWPSSRCHGVIVDRVQEVLDIDTVPGDDAMDALGRSTGNDSASGRDA